MANREIFACHDAPLGNNKDTGTIVYARNSSGGYYDRFIERLRDDAVTIGIAFELQIFPEVPKEPHDAQLDYIVTESRILTPNK